jgi:hypothetical protein
MKRLLMLASCLLPLTPALASSASGDFLICATEDNQIRMTADLSHGKGEKTAVAFVNGRRVLLEESTRGQARHRFYFYADKKTPLLVTRTTTRAPEIRLSVDPLRSGYTLVLDRQSPVLYRVAKYSARLSVKSPGVESIENKEVACTESKWASD